MTTQTTNTEVRELTVTEIDATAGAVIDPFSALVGAAIVLVGIGVSLLVAK
ncbi:MAG: hypothetical protein AB7O57_08165 [Hyphomicrobiaceae bacterium]